MLNQQWSFTIHDGTHIDLIGSTFVGSWTSGGFVTPIAKDGLPLWPGPVIQATGAVANSGVGLERSGGFSGTLIATTNGGQVFAAQGLTGPLVDAAKFNVGDPVFPIDIVCGAVDAVPGVHDYAWFVSLRNEIGLYPVVGSSTPLEVTTAQQIFVVSQPEFLRSGHIQLSLNMTAVGQLLPGVVGASLLTPDSFELLCKNVMIYCTRYSDHSYQWGRLFTRGLA